MKFSTFLPFLAVGAIAAPTSPEASLVQRETSLLETLLVNLVPQVKQHAAALNATAASVPKDASEEQKQVATKDAISQINQISALIASTTSQVEALSKLSKRQGQPNLSNLPENVLGQLNGQPIVFAKLLNEVVRELQPALQSVLVTANLPQVYTALLPLLTVQLPGLVTQVGNLVNGLLVALGPLLFGVGNILAPLLLALGL